MHYLSLLSACDLPFYFAVPFVIVFNFNVVK